MPVDADMGEGDEVLMEDATRTKFADQLAQMHLDIQQSEFILRARAARRWHFDAS